MTEGYHEYGFTSDFDIRKKPTNGKPGFGDGFSDDFDLIGRKTEETSAVVYRRMEK